MASRSAPKKKLSEWQISRIAKKGVYIGRVEASDADAAIKTAISKYDIPPEHQANLAARRIAEVA